MTAKFITHIVYVRESEKRKEAEEDMEFQNKINGYLKTLGTEGTNKKEYELEYQAVPLIDRNKTIAIKYTALISTH